jgi:Tfp pilus assembly protein PilX
MDLFEKDLAEVSFPGVDMVTLKQVIGDVRKHTKAVTDAEVALDKARTALRESEEQLSTKTQRALAYARVFAEDRPELLAKVTSVARVAGALSASTPAKSAAKSDASGDAPKRRGRPKKVTEPDGAAAGASPAEPAAPIALPAGDEDPANTETNGKAQTNGAAKTAPVEA